MFEPRQSVAEFAFSRCHRDARHADARSVVSDVSFVGSLCFGIFPNHSKFAASRRGHVVGLFGISRVFLLRMVTDLAPQFSGFAAWPRLRWFLVRRWFL